MGLKSDSAPGLDGINNRMLKQIQSYITVPLTHICNLSLIEGTFPDEWKEAGIIPIYKSGDKDDPGSYRPISLLPSLSKILEKLVNKRLINFLEKNKLISDRQFGFRKGRSTEDAVTILTGAIANQLDRGLACIGVFLDLAKAFDTVSLQILLKKMEAMGVRGISLTWFQSYLSRRKQCVKVANHSSDFMEPCYGVPQGSILGPTLFLIYINDITTVLDDVEMVCYADDTGIIFCAETWNELYRRVEQGMSKVATWLQHNLLTLNLKKTKYLCFYKTKASSPDLYRDIKVYFCGTSTKPDTCMCSSINRAPTIPYLGVVLDENLNFSSHIRAVAGRVRKLIYLFKYLRNAADKQLLRTVYITLCQSIIGYCISVWGGAATTHMMPLERAQRAILKVMHRLPYRHPTSDLYKFSDVLSVRKLYIHQAVILCHRAIRVLPSYQKLCMKRVYKFPIPSINTSFARRFGTYQHPYLYNKISKIISLKDLPARDVKIMVFKYLDTLSYDQAEQLLRHVV